MRANTKALIADSRFSLIDTPKGKWALFRTQSPREMLEAARLYTRGANETGFGAGATWQGLGPEQTRDELDSCGIPRHAKALSEKASAQLVRKPSRPGRVQSAIVGGSWSVPAVLANLPLAARTRGRSKLPPLTLNLVCTYSGSVSTETLAPVFAKLARAIWDYTLAGGAVSLTVSVIGIPKATSTRAKGIIVQTRVPTNDIAQIALALSTVFPRSVACPLASAFSESPRDQIGVPTESENPVANSIYIGGRTSTGSIGPELQKALDSLAIR